MSEGIKIVTTNRQARREYHIEETLEAGMVLVGTEVKSLRAGKANMQDAYCVVRDGEMLLLNLHISPYSHGNQFNHDPIRPRKLLMHGREIAKWGKKREQKGYTIIPLKIYFKRGYAKIEIGLGVGKKLYDKRADLAERDTKRRLERVKRGGQFD